MSQSSDPIASDQVSSPTLSDGLTLALETTMQVTLVNAPVLCGWHAICGRTMLNKYYGLLDDSVMYWIAMCMPSIIQLVANTNLCLLQCYILSTSRLIS